MRCIDLLCEGEVGVGDVSGLLAYVLNGSEGL